MTDWEGPDRSDPWREPMEAAAGAHRPVRGQYTITVTTPEGVSATMVGSELSVPLIDAWLAQWAKRKGIPIVRLGPGA